MPPDSGEPIYIGIDQAAKTFYHKASNGNVSIIKLAVGYSWATYSLTCSKCQDQLLIKEQMPTGTETHKLLEFCGEHQHLDWVSYKVSVKAANRLRGLLGLEEKEPTAFAAVEEQIEGRRFRGDEE